MAIKTKEFGKMVWYRYCSPSGFPTQRSDDNLFISVFIDAFIHGARVCAVDIIQQLKRVKLHNGQWEVFWAHPHCTIASILLLEKRWPHGRDKDRRESVFHLTSFYVVQRWQVVWQCHRCVGWGDKPSAFLVVGEKKSADLEMISTKIYQTVEGETQK